MRLPLGRQAYERTVSQEPHIVLKNRFFEQNPTNLETQVALLARPGYDYLDAFGSGPIRKLFSQPGVFNNDAFVVSGQTVFRYAQDGTKTLLPGTLAAGGQPEMAATRALLWLTDGTNLFYYNGIGNFAKGTLTWTGNAVNAEQVVIGSVTYVWTSSTPSSPNEVAIGVDAETSIDNLVLAITAGTGEGTIYGAGTVANPDATAVKESATELLTTALAAGTAGNSVATTTTMTNASWGDTNLEDGTNEALVGVATPDDVSILSLDVLADYVLLGAANSDRVYFVRPGATTIDPLDFFTAETAPDKVVAIRVFGDQVWFIGERTNEAWYLSGASPIPFARVKGQAFSRGAIQGTALKVGNSIVLVGDDGVVYRVGGGLQRISTHGIEEKIRMARKAERENP